MNNEVKITFCEVDRLFYIYSNDHEIHAQKTKPNEADLIEALNSDNWEARFKDMKEGKRVRVSSRIYFEMLGSVPPIKPAAFSFYCGEPYSGNKYYYFNLDEKTGLRYGELKELI